MVKVISCRLSVKEVPTDIILAVSRQPSAISKETLWQTCDACMPHAESRWFPTAANQSMPDR